jgi:PAS domain S-box-containing protein
MLDGVYLSTHEGRFVDVNSALVKMFGYSSRQEMLDIKDIKKELYFSPEERGRHILDTDQEEVKEYRMRRKDGSEVWVEDHGGYVHDEQGNIIYHEGILRDITQRRRAEEAVRDSEEKYRTIFQNSPLGIFRSTFGGQFLEANPALAKMFGYSSPENMVREIYDVAKQMYAHAEDRNKIITQQLGSNDITQHLNHYRRKDGSEFIANLYVKTVRDRKGQPAFLEGIVEDITERKQMEEELERYSLHLEELVAERTGDLQKSEERYRELFEACPVSLWEEDYSAVKQFTDELRQKGVSNFDAYFTSHPKDVEKCATMVRIININRASLSLYGAKSGNDISGGSSGLSGVFTEESNRQFAGQLAALAQGREYYEAEVENRTLLGETKHCNLICAVVPGYRQSLAKVLVCLVDLTPQKKLDAELRSTKERLEYVIQSNPAVIYSGKPLPDFSDWELTFVSDRVVSMLGYEPGEFVGPLEFWYSHVHPDAIRDIPVLNQTLWREGRRTFEYQFQHKDGSYRWIHDEASATRDSEGRPVAVYGYWTDITAQKQVEQALQKSEGEYRRLFESSPISLWEEDFSAVKQFLDELRHKGVSDLGAYFATHPKDVEKCAGLVKVLNVNQATLRLYDARSVDEIIGGLSGVLTEDSNRKQFADELLALARGEKYYEAQMDNKTMRGETKHCNVICAVVPGYDQSLARVLVCIVDLTPQKQLQAELVKSQRLAAIGETAAMVGHDLRNPLQGIAGAAYNIRKHLRNALDPSTKEMLAVIDNGVQYANEIINDLLEFSREIQLQLLPTTPKSVVSKTLMDMKVPNNVIVEDTTVNAPEILADEAKVKRLLTNLIQNAIDAMPEGGKLSISSMNTHKEVSISIRDTGFGIPKEMQDKLWIPLSTTKAKGIGLGLPICKRIIEAHGGSISVESTIGKGTTFTLRLPIQIVQSGVNQNE